jgi:hypothetical protein
MMFFILFLLAFTGSTLFAQELNCRVTVEYSSIPVQNRELLREFGSQIEEYMNKTRFSNDTWQGPRIDCSISIYVMGASGETNYSAQAVITSQRPVYQSRDNSLMLSINDNSWSFRYERGQPIHHNPGIFEGLTSFLDFYAYIIIGFDMDSWDEMGGQMWFTRAMDVVNLGASNRAAGWDKSSSSYSRRGLADNLLNDKYRAFREAYFNYHYNGIDLFSRNPAKAQENIVRLITTLDAMRTKIDFNSVLIKTFFDAKNGEIIDRLRGYENKDIFKVLKRVDPARISKYDEAMLM